MSTTGNAGVAPAAAVSSARCSMWTETAVCIGDLHVTVSLQLLEPHERESVAASVAWLAAASGAPASGSAAVNAAIWKALVETVLGPHISFTVKHDNPEQLDAAWWDEAIRRATVAFIEANALEPHLRRLLPGLEAHAQGSRRVS